MKMVKALFGAFVVGGAFGVAGDLLIALFIQGLGMPFSTGITLALLALGLIGSLLYVSGADPKITKFGGCGAILVFSGLATGTANAVAGIRESGAPLGKAVAGSVKSMLAFVAIVVVISTAIGLLAGWILA